MQPANSRQGTFDLAYIEYDLIKYENAWMERVEYSTAIGSNAIHEYYIEYFTSI